MKHVAMHDPLSEDFVHHVIGFPAHVPCRCASWYALVDVLGALVAFLILVLCLQHLPAVLR